MYIEQDRKKEIDVLRNKLESNYSDEIETIKKSHLMTLDNVEAENDKLKELFNQRNQENEQLTTKILKQKSHYEDSISILRKENDTIRGKLIEYERLFET